MKKKRSLLTGEAKNQHRYGEHYGNRDLNKDEQVMGMKSRREMVKLVRRRCWNQEREKEKEG